MMDFLKQGGEADLDKLGVGETVPDAEFGSDSSFVTTASHEKSVKKGTIVLVIVFCVSLACLWFMIKKTTPQTAAAKTASEDNMQIEKAIAKIVGTKAEFFKGIDNVVGKFNEFSSVMQIRVGELRKNPFELQKFSTTSMPADQSEAEFAMEREKSLKFELEKEATGMQLLSIMSSPSGSCCMINDKILKKDDMIDGWKVVAITKTSVVLSAQGMQKTLVMSSD
jgi:hypothetical protein